MNLLLRLQSSRVLHSILADDHKLTSMPVTLSSIVLNYIIADDHKLTSMPVTLLSLVLNSIMADDHELVAEDFELATDSAAAFLSNMALPFVFSYFY
jgi:hypothetical protein